VTTADGLNLELVVGPERLAFYAAPPLPGGTEVTLLSTATAESVKLEPKGDHFEASNPFGAGDRQQLVAVLQDAAGSRVARFEFTPGEGSTFHDHRPFHGGYVGMAGDRHLEIALVPLGRGDSGAEIQLYLSDAYRQPLPVDGARASVTFASGKTVDLHPVAGSLVGRIANPHGPLDTHVAVTLPGEKDPIEMDFYIDPKSSSPGPAAALVEIHVSDAGFVPARISATAGKALTLRFLRTSSHTCATEVVFPEQGLRKELPLGQPVEVALVPHTGEIAFSCGMRMFKGQIVAR
jgi:hypothetical protein